MQVLRFAFTAVRYAITALYTVAHYCQPLYIYTVSIPIPSVRRRPSSSRPIVPYTPPRYLCQGLSRNLNLTPCGARRDHPSLTYAPYLQEIFFLY